MGGVVLVFLALVGFEVFFFFSVLLGVFFVDFFLSAVLELADETHWLN